MTTEICMIVAATLDGVIGMENTLPWDLPEDLAYFKATTMGHPIVMGRKTYESIGRPLPGRANYVLTRQPIAIPRVNVIDSPIVPQSDSGKVFVIGGSEVYKAYESMITRIYLTRVHLEVTGDAFLPFPITEPKWQLESQRVIKTESGTRLDFQVFMRNYLE